MSSIPILEASPMMGEAWDALEAADLPAESWLERPLTWIGGALDGAAVLAMQIVVDRVLAAGPAQVAEIRRSAAPFLVPELQRDPALFFAGVEAEPCPPATESFLGPMPGGLAVARRIHCGAGDPLLVEHWVHVPGRPAGTVVALHGFAMGNPRIDAMALQARDWFRAGLDVALCTLPFHGARTPSDARFSGERFATADVGGLNQAVRQAVREIRTLVGLLRGETTAPVGVIGLSLGGYLAALLASLGDDLDFVVPIVPPACMGDLAWRFFAATHAGRDAQAPTLTREELRACFRLHSPLAHRRRLPRERLLIVAGRGDRIVPPEHPYALWRHWDEPAIHWFSGSHLAPFGRRGIAETVLAHLRGLGIL